MNVVRRQSKMTVDAFQDWQPPVFPERRWQLIDGTPVCMSPPSSDHARLVGELTFLLKSHVNATMPGCDVLVGGGIAPPVNPTINHLIPDIIVTCEPAGGARSIQAPIVIVEFLSPSNAKITRANAETFKTVASVQEILLLESLKMSAEFWRRESDGSWRKVPIILRAEELIELQSIGFTTSLTSLCRLTSLAAPR